LLFLAVCTSLHAQPAGIHRQVYLNLDPASSSLAALTNSPGFLQDEPDQSDVLSNSLETERNRGDHYGQRLRAFLIPPATGNYTFWIAGDELSQLFLSTNESPANIRLVAAADPRSQFRVWTTHAGQQSAPVALQAGRRYYLEVLHREGLLLDHLSVRWRLPDGTVEEPIPASRFVHEIAPLITSPPASLSVEESRPARFSVATASFLPQQFQWQRNGGAIPGATNASYSLPVASLADDGASFRVAITNLVGSTNSAPVTLNVRRDTNAPVLLEVVSVSPTTLLLAFSEAVTTNSATHPANYSLSGLSITAAQFGGDAQTVLLTTSPLTWETSYTLSAGNLSDRASIPNLLVSTQITFTARSFNASDVGSASPAGSITTAGSGFDVSGGGSGTTDGADQLQFAWQIRDGDFDLMVRLDGLVASDVWARAGLMAREDLGDSSRFAAVFATPSFAGCFFQSRANPGWPAPASGSFPAHWPNAWLRLKRAGATFTGFAGNDGRHWTALGSTALSLPARLYLGLSVASHQQGQSAVARFRDFAPSTADSSPALADDREPHGPSSRRTGLALTEIMYHPRDGLVGTNSAGLQFVELFNSNPFYEDLGGYRLTGDIEFTFPPATLLPGGGHLVVVRSPADFQTAYGLANALGPFTGGLPNDSGLVRLRNASGHVLLEVNYESKFPWPVAADGAGHSLVLARSSYGEGQREAWTASDALGGSPGRPDPFGFDPLRPVVINEFLAHTDDPQLDFIELYNHSNEEADLSGAFLTDSPATNKFRIPAGTTIPPRGFVSFDQDELGFALDATGERIFLVNSNQTRVIDAISFRGQANGVSTGRFPDGSPTLQDLESPTPGQPNAPLRIPEVVINEIMYHPISNNTDDEFVELYNLGTSAVDLGGWRISGGIDFMFATNATIPAGGYLVVARNTTNLLSRYSQLNPANTVGNFSGSLGNGGDRITLSRPEEVVGTNLLGQLETNLTFVVVNEVEYQTGGQWGPWSDGGGSSLELVDSRTDNRLAANWADSDETSKAPWTTVEFTGVLDNAAGGGDPPDTLHVMLLEAGACLLDDVEAFRAGGGNRIANPGFETDLAGWIPRGNHVRSSREITGGFNSPASLHLRATSQGDIGANHIRAPLTSAFTLGQTVTLRAKARWLRGWPELLLRLRGNSLEACGRLAVPANLGTPGQRNSRARNNAGPAIFAVSHSPAVPAAMQPVVVTARVSDPDGVASLALKYRIDPSPTLATLAMNDTGLSGDAIAGDGVFSATIPGQAADTIAAFIVDATDDASPAATHRFPATPPDNSPVRECVIHFGGEVPASSFGTYRFWITQSTIDAWSNREVLSNERLFGTFVYGDHRVIYNVGGRYSGSPAHQDQAGPDISPVGSPYHFAFDLPKDDLLLGTDNFNKIHGAGNNIGDDDTLQREVTAYWMAQQLGLPANYKRFVQFFVNGQRRGSLYEDTLVPGANQLDSVFNGDDDGDLFKLSIQYEFDQSNNQLLGYRGNGGATLNEYLSGGAKKTARYRWTWQPRALNGTANNFTNVFALVDAANTPTNSNNGADFIASLEAVADMDQWMQTFALEHALGNWDSFGFRNPQNMYAYKPTLSPWQLLIWDINIIIGGGTRGTPVGPVGDDLLEYNTGDTPLGRIYNTPKFLRSYWRALQETAADLMDAGTLAAPLDARFAAFNAGSVQVNSPEAIKAWISLRRGYLLSESAKRDASLFHITSPTTVTTSASTATISGVSPLRVKTLTVNDVPWPLTWTSTTNWSLQVPLSTRTNVFALQGLDRVGVSMGSATGTVTIIYTGIVAPPVSVFINEWMAANTNSIADPADGDFDDWFELFNAGTGSVDLSGYFLTDTFTNKTKWTIPSGTTIPPGGFRLVWADEEEQQTGADLHVNFKLGQGGEEIGLFAPDGTLIDHVAFGSQTNDLSQGRWPDGGTNLYFMPTPTPRLPNTIPVPTPPTLLGYRRLPGGQIEMTWGTSAGRTYQLEYKNVLNEANWSVLGSPTFSPGTALIFGDDFSASPQRFYRLGLLP